MRSLVVAMLVACSHPATTPLQSPPPPPAVPLCDRMADHVVSLLGASEKATPEQLDPFRRVLASRCSQDRWTPAAQQCLLDSKTLDDGDKCESLFTPDQKSALERDGKAALQGMQGGAPDSESAKPTGAAPGGGAGGPKRPGDPCEGGE